MPHHDCVLAMQQYCSCFFGSRDSILFLFWQTFNSRLEGDDAYLPPPFNCHLPLYRSYTICWRTKWPRIFSKLFMAISYCFVFATTAVVIIARSMAERGREKS